MKTNNLLLFLFFSISSYQFQVFSQTPILEWQKSFGGTGEDQVSCIQQTSDGGYIVAGSTYSQDGNISGAHGSLDIWVLKLSSSGSPEWNKCFGGSSNDIFECLTQTTDGGYIIGGTSISADGDVGGLPEDKVWIFKINSSGSIIWDYIVTGLGVPKDICQTSDGGYIVAGNKYVAANNDTEDVWLFKLSLSGIFVWEQTYGGLGNDTVSGIHVESDGGFTFGARTDSNDGDITTSQGDLDFWLVKINSTGVIEWEKTYGGTAVDNLGDFKKTTDNGYILFGSSFSNDINVSGNHGGLDCWVLKTNATGVIVWQKSFGGTNFDQGISIDCTSDGGYIILGKTASNDGNITGNHSANYDAWVARLNSSGDILWQKSLGGTNVEIPHCIQQVSDGGYIMAIESNSTDGDITDNKGFNDFWIVKLYSESVSNDEIDRESGTRIYPNPSSNSVYIQNLTKKECRIEILDFTGKEIYTQSSHVENVEIQLNAFVEKGIYFINIIDGNDLIIKTEKIILY